MKRIHQKHAEGRLLEDELITNCQETPERLQRHRRTLSSVKSSEGVSHQTHTSKVPRPQTAAPNCRDCPELFGMQTSSQNLREVFIFHAEIYFSIIKWGRARSAGCDDVKFNQR